MKNFIKEAEKIHNYKYDYSKVNYINSYTKVIIICKSHGEFEQVPSAHLYGNGCKKCSFSSKASNNKEFIKKSNKVHNFKYDYSLVNYTNNLTKVTIICSIHGEFKKRPTAHLSGSGCQKCSLALKTSNNKEFIEKANKVHNFKYNYSKVNYINANEDIIIICPIHGEFKQRPFGHLAGSNCKNCVFISRSLNNNQEFIKRANKIHNNKYDYSLIKCVNSTQKITIICPKHGQFQQSPVRHLNSKGCKICSLEQKSSNIEEFIKRANEAHNNKYDYSKTEYINSSTKLTIICPKHGEFKQSSSSHIAGYGCKKCAHNLRSSNNEEFIERAKLVHGDRYDYSKVNYINAHTKIIIICKDHGEFLQTPNNHIKNRNCSECNRNCVSKLETQWLDSLNIPIQYRQASITIKNKKYLTDAYNPETNTVYEFNGDFWHGNPKFHKAEDINDRNKITFGELYSKTLEKEKTLKEAGYNVVSIWENEFKQTLLLAS